VTTQAPSRILFRIVTTDPPTLVDFTSNATRGRPLQNPTSERRRQWAGLSAFATAAQARRNARKFPQLGLFIAMLVVPDDGSVHLERTGSSGHHTIWGSPAFLLSCVAQVTSAT